SIMYAVRCTRPDVAFAQNLVSRYQQNPGKLHWVVVKHILKYLRNTKDMFLVYGGNPDIELEKFDGLDDPEFWWSNRQVSIEEGDAKAREHGVMFVETSAKAGFNIKIDSLRASSLAGDLAY
ncbi:retrotransposon protein, putative, ty1-copia subclass, partial [Tanacetum coccineum]